MKIFFLILSLLFSQSSYAQRSERLKLINTEIKSMFLDSMHNWATLTRRAQAENKLIYIYCRSSSDNHWSTFLQEYLPPTVKEFLLQNFILLTIEFDTYKKDEFFATIADTTFIDSLKKAASLRHSCFLIYSKDGEPLAKSTYSFPDSTYKINFLQEIIDGKHRYFTLLRDFRNGNRQPGFIREFKKAYDAAISYPPGDTVKIFEQFIAAYPGNKIFTKANGQLIYDNVNFIFNDACSQILYVDRKKWFKILGKSKVENKIINELTKVLALYADLYPRNINQVRNWEDAKVKYFENMHRYSAYDSVVVAKATPSYYLSKNLPVKLLESLPRYLKYNKQFKEEITIVNDYALTVLIYDSSRILLQPILKWCRPYLAASQNSNYLHTYAALEYLAGNNRTAIIHEQKAMNLATEKEKKVYRTILDRMKMEKTIL